MALGGRTISNFGGITIEICQGIVSFTAVESFLCRHPIVHIKHKMKEKKSKHAIDRQEEKGAERGSVLVILFERTRKSHLQIGRTLEVVQTERQHQEN